ncbi:hypothetical protein N5T79_06550 [Aliarcobacter cryaerophilus]|uniref:hypothetical protein n=1 Tax=Aliarcobacter cryaerophilus TaxID=28198 RepID=UPI0021B5276A|nr:hypothetical protein [Aliarcobacter cryaerophilus]MCT7528802.1 hypothetical protein [Aliarcobacter cryaerophilus]
MAKLSDRQKNNIIAKWKTGQYTKIALAKTYKVDEKTIRKITENIEPKNADFVEATLMLEKAKKSELSPIEITEIDKAVKYRLEKEFSDDNKKVRIYDTSFKILNAIDEILKKGKVEEKVSVGDGVQQFEERHLNANDTEKLANAVDKLSITTNVNQRHSTSQININNENTNAQQNNINIEWE